MWPSQKTLGQYLLRSAVLYQLRNCVKLAVTPFSNTKQGPALLLLGPSSNACRGPHLSLVLLVSAVETFQHTGNRPQCPVREEKHVVICLGETELFCSIVIDGRSESRRLQAPHRSCDAGYSLCSRAQLLPLGQR